MSNVVYIETINLHLLPASQNCKVDPLGFFPAMKRQHLDREAATV